MNDILDQAQQYREHVLYLGYGHYKRGKVAARQHTLLGVPVVVATSIVGTSIFATLSAQMGSGWAIATGLISLAATVLAALQTFFGFSDLAFKSKAAGARYGALRRRIDLFLLRFSKEPEQGRSQALAELENIAEEIAQLADQSPDLPDRFYDKGKEVFSAGQPETEGGSPHRVGS